MLRFSPILKATTKRSFHTSNALKFKIPFLPALPQVPGGVKGNVNEAYVPPKMDKLHGSFHWDIETVTKVAIIPLVTVPVLTMSTQFSTTTDIILGVTAMTHFMLEFQSCIIDYISRRMYGPIHSYAMYLLYAGSLLSVIGIYNLNSGENKGILGTTTEFFSSKTQEEEKKA